MKYKLHKIEVEEKIFKTERGTENITVVRMAVPGGWIYAPDSDRPIFVADPSVEIVRDDGEDDPDEDEII